MTKLSGNWQEGISKTQEQRNTMDRDNSALQQRTFVEKDSEPILDYPRTPPICCQFLQTLAEKRADYVNGDANPPGGGWRIPDRLATASLVNHLYKEDSNP
jgi:hypothetical protein